MVNEQILAASLFRRQMDALSWKYWRVLTHRNPQAFSARFSPKLQSKLHSMDNSDDQSQRELTSHLPGFGQPLQLRLCFNNRR